MLPSSYTFVTIATCPKLFDGLFPHQATAPRAAVVLTSQWRPKRSVRLSSRASVLAFHPHALPLPPVGPEKLAHENRCGGTLSVSPPWALSCHAAKSVQLR